MTARMQEIFFEVYEPLPRQGPGSFACTERAFGLCRALPASPRIVDLGCGSGGQTLHLARLVAKLPGGSILAIDSHAPLVERLRARLEDEAPGTPVETRIADMTALDLPPASFDLVWSEGALYNLGLERALPLCAGLLRPGGYLAFTDAVWRTDDPPPDVRESFAEYPTMGKVADVVSLLQRGGWSAIEHFDLPAEAWWDDFYRPMERQIEALRTKYADDDEALAILDELAKEPQMHRDSGHCFGYTFFVARRP